MVNLNIKNAAINRALLLNKIPIFRFAGSLMDLFLVLSVLFVLLEHFSGRLYVMDFPFLGYGILSFVLFLFFLEMELFFKHTKSPKLFMGMKDIKEDDLKEVNLAEFLDFESAKIIKRAGKIGGADSYLLLFHILRYSREMDFVFYRSLIDKERMASELENVFKKRERVREEYLESFFEVMKEAFLVAKERGNERITLEDIFVALGEHNSYLQGVFYEEGLKRKDLMELTSWQLRLKSKDHPFTHDSLVKKGKLGIEWASGHTPLLDKFSVDWTKKMKIAGFPETIGHKEEIEALERVLSRGEANNPLLVGEPGSGRKSIIQDVIRRSYSGESLSQVNFKRFLELDLSSLVSHAEGVEETESLLDSVFSEAENAGNVVLIINDIDNFMSGEQRPGIVDISGVLNSYLHLPSFALIGVTSYEGFHNNIEKNPISSLMEKVEVGRVNKEETLWLLERRALALERKYHKLIPFCSLKKIISLSDRYIQDHPFPEKAVDLLEEAMVHIEQQKVKILLPKHIERLVSEKTEIPVGEIDEKEREILLNMERLLHERIVDQEQAVSAVSKALRRSRAQVDTRKALIGSFLFLGPTGTGKTEMAKAITDVYFGSKDRMIRLDMSEFQTVRDLGRLIGSPGKEGVLTLKVKEDPFSLLLFDEIEKAHPDILNLFLQLLDEGHITDGMGKKVDFRNTMVIATSNAGYQTILDAIEKNENWSDLKKRILRRLFKESTFRPEFVNRFDEVVLFKPLSKEELFMVAGMQLEDLRKGLKEKEIDLQITEELKRRVVEMSYDPVFGAREMQRVIQDNIGDALSSVILKKEVKEGDSLTIDPKDFSVKKM